MTTKKTIEISYIKEKVDKSPIITIEKNASIIESQNEINDIKNSIMGILECTNIKEQLEKNKEGRHLYKIQEDVSKHIYSVISGKYTKEEKKEIVKDIIKSLMNSISIVLTRGKNIYINDSGIKDKIIKIQNEEKAEKRFNGYEGNELEELINDYIGNEKEVQNFLKQIINNINYNKLHLDQIISILTLGYKGFLLNEVSKGVKNKFNLENEITSAISGKILRDNFSYSNIILYENIYNILLENKLKNINLTDKIIENIIVKYFNFQKNEIFDNINKVKQIFNKELKDSLSKNLNKIFLFEGTINENAFKVIKMKLGITLDNEIYKKIIENIIQNLITTFKENSSKLPTPTIEFLKRIGINYPEIKVSYLKTPTDIIKLSSNLKLLLNDKNKIEKSIESKKEMIKKLKKENEIISNGIKGLELNYDRNKKEINKQLIKIGFNSLLNTELVTGSLLEESKKNLEYKNKLSIQLKKLSSNTIKKTINSSKIEKIKKQIEKIKKRTLSIEIIIKLIKENIAIKNKIDKFYDINKKIALTNNSINEQNIELESINNKINQIKEGLVNIFLNS